MIRFDETVRGRKFFDGQLPALIKAIQENTAEMKRANDLKEKEMKIEHFYNRRVFKRAEHGEPEPVQDARDSLHDSRD